MLYPEPDSGKKKVSIGGLDVQVDYYAHDSMYFDVANQLVYLWDSAMVDYGEVHLEAFYIVVDFRNNVVTAEGRKDSLGNYLDKANFVSGDDAFEAVHLAYNFKTMKGRIEEVTTQQGEGILHAEVVKKDTGKVIYGSNGVFTTCDLDHPHYGIYAGKMKIIQDDKIVTGPAYLRIADVPTPLGIPFGFFPNKKGRKSGIIIPSYGESAQLGYFLRDGGYYWGISDKMDMALRGDIYSRGSFGLKLYTNYKVRYKYSGNLAVKYSRILTGEPEIPTHFATNDFFVTWSHVQDPKFNPSIRFSANVNAGSSSYNTYNATQTAAYLQNTFQSNVAWSKTWRIGSLSANLRHNQNIFTHQVQLGLPQLAFSTNRLYPFRNTKRLASHWYNKIGDKIGFSYQSEFQNNLNIADSMLNWEHRDYVQTQLQNGIKQSIPVSASFNVLRFFTLTMAGNANSITQFRTINKVYTFGGVNNDSAYVRTDTLNGARVSLNWNASATLTTKLYGMFYFRRTRFSAMRHTLTPAFSFTYMPDFTQSKYGYFKTVQTNAQGATSLYSIFDGGVYGAPSAGKTGAIGFNLLNNLEGKKRPLEGDSTSKEERVSLIDAFNFGCSYNLMAEHFNWSQVSMSFRTKLFRRFDLNANASADPYRLSDDGVRIERFEWREGKRLARLTNATASINTSLRKGGLTSSTTHSSSRGTEAELNMVNSNPTAYVDFNIPWSLTMGYALTWSKPTLTSSITQTLRFSGDVNVTPKWKVGFDSNFDIQKKEFGYTSLNVYRDLHCWEMQFNWIPFGIRQSYNITISVKSAMLQDLKLTRKRDWYDFVNY